MIDDALVKLIQKTIKDEVRPLKEQIEIVKSKVSHLDLYTSATNSNVRSVKEQQSVINEKLDGIDEIKDQLSDLSDIIGNRIYPSVVEIEQNITAYADMYKINNDNSKKLDKRVGVVEDRLDIRPDPEFSLAEVS